jgi:hypothetical protein
MLRHSTRDPAIRGFFEYLQHATFRDSSNPDRGWDFTVFRGVGVGSSLRDLVAFAGQSHVARPQECGSVVPLARLEN